MHFKNHKSSEFYILPNLVHTISILAIFLQFIMHRGIGITRPFPISVSLARSLRPMPDSGACADPTTITAACTHARTPPRRLWQLARHHDNGSLLPPFPPSFFYMHGHSTFVYTQQMKQDKAPTEATFTFTIYHANKQGTHTTYMYHQHIKHKQTSVSSAPTHTHIQIAHA
jgi:hypothetical protein